MTMEAHSEPPPRPVREQTRAAEREPQPAPPPAAVPPQVPQIKAADVLPKRGTKERTVLDMVVGWVERRYGQELGGRIAALKMQSNEAGFDPFGFDPEVARYMLAAMVFVHRTYFRTEVFGIDRVPQGRALLVANHSGHLPI